MSTPLSKKAEKSEITRAALIRVAREMFTERGYAGSPTEEIVERAGVTRGALYHHFVDKRGLFEAVYESVLQEVSLRTMMAATAVSGTAWEKMTAGLEAYIRASLGPSVRQVVMVDGPSVLGWESCGEINSRYGQQLIRSALAEAMREGSMADFPIDTLTNLLGGSVREAVLLVEQAEDREQALGEVLLTFGAILRGLKAD